MRLLLTVQARSVAVAMISMIAAAGCASPYHRAAYLRHRPPTSAPSSLDPKAGAIWTALARYEARKYHVYPQIPPEKLRNARSSCNVPLDETVLALIDASVWGSAKQALVFGTLGVYFHNDWASQQPGAGFLAYADFGGVTFDSEGYEVALGVGSFNSSGASLPGEGIVDVLKDVQAVVTGRVQIATPAPSPAPAGAETIFGEPPPPPPGATEAEVSDALANFDDFFRSLLSIHPIMRIAYHTTAFRARFGTCPRSRAELEPTIVVPTNSTLARHELFRTFDRISFYESPPGHCVIEYSQIGARLSHLVPPSESKVDFDPWIPPRRGTVRLEPSFDDGGHPMSPVRVDLFEATEGGRLLSEQALPTLYGVIGRDPDSDSGDMVYRFDSKKMPREVPSQVASQSPIERPPPPAAVPKPRHERRFALVIGNAGYTASPLRNPINDATDIAAKLRQVGFEVTLLQDATRQEMEEAVSALHQELSRGGVGFFYFSGHGAQVDGQNFLIPVGTTISTEADLRYKGVSAEWILETLEDASNRLNIVVLDACRNNPYPRGSRSGSRGLAFMPGGRGSLIAYATAPGQTAADGAGRNSPYTRSLVRYIDEPGVAVERMFKRVGAAVQQETRGKQVPWVSMSLIEDFYIVAETSN